MSQELIDCLLALGYPPQHRLIQALHANNLLYLTEKDEYGLSPLARAIQQQDDEAIALLFPYAKELNEYEQAYLTLLYENTIKNLPNHEELIQCIRALYPNTKNDGKCFGISSMAQQAFSIGQTENFYRRLAIIKNKLWPAVQQAIAQMNYQTHSSREPSQLFAEVRKIIQVQFPYAIWYDLYAFLDGVLLYQDPHLFTSILGKTVNQRDIPAERILRPVLLDKKADINTPYEFKHFTLGNYTKTKAKLSTYFTCLDEAFLTIQKPISLSITKGGHALTIGYNQGLWSFYDVAYLSEDYARLNHEALVDIICSCYSDPFIFFAQLFISHDANKKQKEQLEQNLQYLEENPKWIELHKITREQIIIQNERGYCLLHFAALYGKVTLIEKYIDKLNQDDLSTTINQNTATPLYMAVEKEHKNIVQLILIALKGNVPAITKSNKAGVSPLHIAVKQKNLEIVQLLLLALQDSLDAINKAQKNGATPLFVAAQQGAVEIAQLLLNHQADVHQAMTAESEVLLGHARANSCEQELTDLLHSKGYQQEIPGFTPLQVAIIFGHDDVIVLLLRHGACIVNSHNQLSVYELAQIMGKPSTINLIEETRSSIKLKSPPQLYGFFPELKIQNENKKFSTPEGVARLI